MTMQRTGSICSSSLVGLVLAWSSLASAANRGPDFDNDNIDDIALGVPDEDVSTMENAGLVNILYGSGTGLVDPANRITSIWRDLANVAGASAAADGFGQSLAWGDFDGDCFDDLVVGVFGGEAQVFYGSATGLSTADDEIIFSGQLTDAWALAAGDFNGDGFDDIAVGTAFFEEVTIIYGSSSGLDLAAGPGSQVWSLASPSIIGTDTLASFGRSLAAGDFNCDGKDDLAVGAEDEDEGTEVSAGRVHILYGSSGGLSSTGNQSWGQDSSGVIGVAEQDDAFGFSLAVGNFNNDTSSGHACHDLAVGIVREEVNGFAQAGAVSVFYGSSASGIQTSSPANQLWHQDATGITDAASTNDRFGFALLVGRLDVDDFEDLVVGIPGEGSGGAVAIIRGSSAGLVSTSNMLWNQDSANIADSEEVGDEFGSCLGYGQEWYTPLNRALAVCAPSEDHSSVTEPGLLNVNYLQDTSTPQTSILGNAILQNSIDTRTNDAGDKFASNVAAPRDRPFVTDDCD